MRRQLSKKDAAERWLKLSLYVLRKRAKARTNGARILYPAINDATGFCDPLRSGMTAQATAQATSRYPFIPYPDRPHGNPVRVLGRSAAASIGVGAAKARRGHSAQQNKCYGHDTAGLFALHWSARGGITAISY
jgi:hypothetical protein